MRERARPTAAPLVIVPRAFARERALARLADEEFDVLVVGGGVTGCGTALDLASRGLATALVEKDDFASGTSSRSSKLVHGGLRYIQQRELALVYEGLAERQRLLRTAPHLVSVLPFLIPLLGRDGVVPRRLVKAFRWALWTYDLTGGARIGRLHDRISRDEALAHMPTLAPERVTGGYLYYDARADDARLTLALARTAADQGAAVANHARVVSLRKDAAGRVDGAVVEAEGERLEVRARAVVNAAGVWADEVRALDEGRDPSTLRPAKGIHLTVPWARVRNDVAVVLPVPGDRRSIFVVPWNGFTYVGTTDTDYDGDLDEPTCTPDDVAYLLGAMNAALAEPLTPADVLACWAGLRPLVRDAGSDRTADLSRRHRVHVSPSGVVTVAGGKLTAYRRMAADAGDEVAGWLGRGGRSRTRSLPLRGATGTAALREPSAAMRLGVDRSLLDHLVGRYGGEARAVVAMLARDPSLGAPLVPGLPYVRAEALFAVRYEMARTLDDVLARRTRARALARDATAAAAGEVATLVGAELGWSDREAERRAATYRAELAAERSAADLPETVLATGAGTRP